MSPSVHYRPNPSPYVTNKKHSRCQDSASCMDATLKTRFEKFQTRYRTLPVAADAHKQYHSIRQMQFAISVLYWSNAQLAQFLKLLPSKCKTLRFAISHLSSSVEFWIPWYYNLGRVWLAGSQGTDVSCHVPIFTFFTTSSQSINIRQTDRQTDRGTDAYIARHNKKNQDLSPRPILLNTLTWHCKNLSSHTAINDLNEFKTAEAVTLKLQVPDKVQTNWRDSREVSEKPNKRNEVDAKLNVDKQINIINSRPKWL